MKFKELIKTIILTGLVISSLVLSGKIWFSKELWPDGYNSFHYATNSNLFSKFFSVFDSHDSKALKLSQIFSPKQLLINKEGRNLLLSPDSDETENLNNLLKENLEKLILNGDFSEISEDEFKKAAKSASVFVDFYNYISFEMLADYYGAAVTSDITEIYNVKHLLFHIDDDSSIGLFAKNNKTGKIFKGEITGNTKELVSLCNNLIKKVPEGTVSSSFAFENNFDKKTEGDSKKLLLNSYMLINLNSSSLKNIVPVMIAEFNEASYNLITNHFSIRPGLARRFMDSSGTVNFVENFATLKFHKDGLLEYNSASGTEGIELKGAHSSDYEVVKLVGEFTEELNKNFNLPDGNKYIFSGVEADDDGKYTICFDILYNGTPVILKRNILAGEMLNHAIEIQFENGRIISYKQVFTGFNQVNSREEMPPMITALDEFYTSYDTEKNPDLVINDIYNIYHFDIEKNTVEAKCAVSLSNKEVIIVKP